MSQKLDGGARSGLYAARAVVLIVSAQASTQQVKPSADTGEEEETAPRFLRETSHSESTSVRLFVTESSTV